MFDPRDIPNPLMSPRYRYRLGRVAQGWIVEDRLLSAKISFHHYKNDAVWALIKIRKAARAAARRDDGSVGQTG